MKTIRISEYKSAFQPGDIVEGWFSNKRASPLSTEMVELLSFNDFHRRSDGKVDRRAKTDYRGSRPLPPIYVKELWLAKSIKTGLVREYKIIHALELDATRSVPWGSDHVDARPTMVIDEYESLIPNILVDSYDEYLRGKRNTEIIDPVLQSKNNHLLVVKQAFEKMLSETTTPNLQKGVKLFIMHLETPTSATLRAKKIYKSEYPSYFSQIKRVYESCARNRYNNVIVPTWIQDQQLYPTGWNSERYEL